MSTHQERQALAERLVRCSDARFAQILFFLELEGLDTRLILGNNRPAVIRDLMHLIGGRLGDPVEVIGRYFGQRNFGSEYSDLPKNETEELKRLYDFLCGVMNSQLQAVVNHLNRSGWRTEVICRSTVSDTAEGVVRLALEYEGGIEELKEILKKEFGRNFCY